MGWPTAFGNAGRNSYAGVPSAIGSEIWSYSFAATATDEGPIGAPIVSAGGFIWIVTNQRTDFWTFFLYCLNPSGELVSKRALELAGTNPDTGGSLASQSIDVCLVPWFDRLKAFDTGACTPGTPTGITILPGRTFVHLHGQQILSVSEPANFTITEGGDSGSLSAASGTSTTYTAGSTPGTYHVVATSQADGSSLTTATIDVNELAPSLWEFVKSVADSSFVHFDVPGVRADDTIVQVWNDDVTTHHLKVSILNADGSLSSEFDTGYRPHISAVPPTTIDSTSVYIAQQDATTVYLNKFSFAGTLTWQYTLGLLSDFNRLLPPSVSGNRVAAFGSKDPIAGFTTVFAWNATTGALDWTHDGSDSSDYSNTGASPAIGADGTVYGGHFGDFFANGRLDALDGSTGNQIWTYTDTNDNRDAPTSPSLGSDGFLIWCDQDINRVSQTDGSQDSQITTLFVNLQVALVTGRAYAASGGSPSGSLHAFSVGGGPTIVFPNGGAPGSVRSAGGGADRANLQDFQGVVFEIYFAGLPDGGDLSLMDYGLPTKLTLLMPVSGREYILTALPVDLAGFQSGRMGNVKLRRLGSENSYSGKVVVRAIELVFQEKP